MKIGVYYLTKLNNS